MPGFASLVLRTFRSCPSSGEGGGRGGGRGSEMGIPCSAAVALAPVRSSGISGETVAGLEEPGAESQVDRLGHLCPGPVRRPGPRGPLGVPFPARRSRPGQAGAFPPPHPRAPSGCGSRKSRSFFLFPSLVELKSDRGKSGAGLRPGRLGLPAPGAIPAGGTQAGPAAGAGGRTPREQAALSLGKVGEGLNCRGGAEEETRFAE